MKSSMEKKTWMRAMKESKMKILFIFQKFVKIVELLLSC